MLSVSDALDGVIAANGSTFVSVLQSDATRAALLRLLAAHGFDGPDAQQTTPNDLATLYASSRKKHSIGKAVADRLKHKYSKNPLLDDVPPASEAPKDDKPFADMPDPFADAPTPEAPTASYDDSRVWRAIGDVRGDVRVLTDGYDGLRNELDGLPDTLAALVDAGIKAQTPTRVEVVRPDAPAIKLDLAHNAVPRLIRMLATGVNVYLYGPAGTGKTTAAKQCADAFGIPFYFAAKVESEYMLLGFKDARGETVRTQFREAYEHGGLFLFDELDGSSAGAVVALNAALANGMCPFPDATVLRHKDFKCIAAGNTALTGATRQYVGRSQLDAASVDRFAFLPFGYDEQLERAVATNTQWCKYVQAVRKAIADRALNHLATPRATYDGCALLAAGDSFDEAADACLWKGLERATVEQLQAVVGDYSEYEGA